MYSNLLPATGSLPWALGFQVSLLLFLVATARGRYRNVIGCCFEQRTLSLSAQQLYARLLSRKWPQWVSCDGLGSRRGVHIIVNWYDWYGVISISAGRCRISHKSCCQRYRELGEEEAKVAAAELVNPVSRPSVDAWQLLEFFRKNFNSRLSLALLFNILKLSFVP